MRRVKLASLERAGSSYRIAWNYDAQNSGATLTLGKAQRGCRACIAIAGGVDVPLVLGSRSTFLPGRFGG